MAQRKEKKSGKVDREKMMEDLMTRAEESERKKDIGSSFSGFFLTDMPRPTWSAKKGDHDVDLIPYQVGKYDNSDLKEGQWTYLLVVKVHYNVGVERRAVICPQQTFTEDHPFYDKCPICLEGAKRCQEIEDDPNLPDPFTRDGRKLWAEFRPKQRAIYNIWVLDDEKEKAKGVQIWDSSHWLLERKLPAYRKKKGGGSINIASPFKDGRTIHFERQGEGADTKYEGIRLDKRDEDIPDEIIEQAIVIDDLQEIYFEAKEETGEEEKPVDKKEKEVVLDDDDDVVLDDDNDVNSDDDVVLEDEVKEEEEEKEEKEEGPECPYGGDFGDDFDELLDCEDCETDYKKIYKACKKASKD